MTRGASIILPALGLALCATLACETVDHNGRRVMAKKAAKAGGFVEYPERMIEEPETEALARVWYEPGFQFSQYRRIAVAEVSIAYLREMSLWQKVTLATPGFDEDIQELAILFREKVLTALREPPGQPLLLIEVPEAGPDDLIMELAIIEFVPNKSWLALVGLASVGNPIIPAGVATATVATFLMRGWVSIEGRLRHAGDGRIVATFADSEKGKTRPFDVEAVTWYGHAHEIFDDWARQFAQRMSTPLNETVEEAPWFTLKPW